MANPQESYTTLLPTYATISEEEYIPMIAPVEKIISDGYSQVVVALQDEATLIEAGMPADYITKTDEAIKGFSWASGLYETALDTLDVQTEQWKAGKKEAYALRKKLVRFGRFGAKINGNEQLITLFDEVNEGYGDQDLIFDLLKLYQIYTAHPTVVNGLNTFDLVWVEQCLELHNTLNDLLANKKNPEETLSPLSTTLKRAYTYYHKTVYNLRYWGEFVFADTPRFSEYQAEFLQEALQGSKNKTVVEEVSAL